jgi:hypothetical protein
MSQCMMILIAIPTVRASTHRQMRPLIDPKIPLMSQSEFALISFAKDFALEIIFRSRIITKKL